jgi:dUTPase
VHSSNPPINSDHDKYIQRTIDYLKSERNKQQVSINYILGNKLCFVPLLFDQNPHPVQALIDTGATTSLMTLETAETLGLKIKPMSINLNTATGSSKTAIKGIAHAKFGLKDVNDEMHTFCTIFVISTNLNNMQAILGAEFLLDPTRVASITGKEIVINKGDELSRILLTKLSPTESNKINTTLTDITACTCDIEYTKVDIQQTEMYLFKTNQEMEMEETLPQANQLFDENFDLDHEVLDKKFKITDGDFTQVPKTYLQPLLDILHTYEDRFSKSKLDLEKTDLYTASLPTIEGKKVVQLCRRLPENKFQFAMKAIKQLQKADVIEEADSTWKSNVVMIPKPVTVNELRQNTKAEKLSGEHNNAKLYRLCLDFRDLNKLLIFEEQSSFPTIDKFTQVLKGKYVISLDISSSFFIIPIEAKDRYKTSFWINEYSFQFKSLVMGLKSSPFHLHKFLKLAFSPEVYKEVIQILTEEERNKVPPSFEDFVISYFDDFDIFHEDLHTLLICFKLVMEASRKAKIKFSIEKSTFLATTIKILGYTFDTKRTELKMDPLKSSGFINMRKPSSLYELQSRLCAFQYQSAFLPYLKNILYPLHFIIRKQKFSWGPVEELAWTQAKRLVSLSLSLVVPEPSDDLVLTTDASKIAASACLFRSKNGKLELISASSKYFNIADLNKNSYTLEAISLAYAFKVFAPYLLNCEGTIRIFTDAKSLIYAKRMQTHSILMNNVLNYITNFISLIKVELYHLPGQLNVLADILSRAITDNLNCSLPKEHPISKQWAKVLPPVPDKLGITHESLYKFLVSIPKTENIDIYDRSHRKLQDPKTLQAVMDIASNMTPEEKYNNALIMLEMWNSSYARTQGQLPSEKDQYLHNIKLKIDLEKERKCLEHINIILDKIYPDIKGTKLYKALQKNLIEASQRFLQISTQPLTESNLNLFHNSIYSTLKTLQECRNIAEIKDKVEEQIKQEFSEAISANNIQPITEDSTSPTVLFKIDESATYLPNICSQSNGLDIPLQETVKLQPFELKKIDLKIKFILPKGYCALLMNKSSARIKYNIQVTLGLIDVSFTDYIKVVIQNMSSETIELQKGTSVAQLLVIPSEIPKFEEKWDTSKETNRGEFGSTGHEFEIKQHKAVQANFTEVKVKENNLFQLSEELSPSFFTLNNIQIQLLGHSRSRSNIMNELLNFEANLINNEHDRYLITTPPLPEQYLNNLDIKETELTDNTITMLLASDLMQNKRLSIESFEYYQNNDKFIQPIKENLLGKNNLKSFILKKNIVCKLYRMKPHQESKYVIYLPQVLLLPTIAYLHKFYLHPSATQTFKQFSQHYYHPHAKRTIKKLCNSCFTCKLSRNHENKNVSIGTERSIKPTAPRQAVSADIIYLPTSNEGHTHALYLVDLFSNYLYFFPMKGKSSEKVSIAMRSFISLQGIPQYLYSDNDPSFQGEVSKLLTSFNIQHFTSEPYIQKQNTIESNVRILKNAFRGVILSNPIFTHKAWHILYPLCIIRLNTMISKYGFSREYIHYKEINDTHLPLIIDTKLENEIEHDLDQLAHDFKGKLKKFLRNKDKNKEYYKNIKKQQFQVGELVMRKIYVTTSPLHPVYKGPYRIIKVEKYGATIKDPRQGDICSAHYTNLRKITPTEFLELLPDYFDQEILQTIHNYRYNKTAQPDKIKASKDDIEDNFLEDDDKSMSSLEKEIITERNIRKLRSGKTISLNNIYLQKRDDLKPIKTQFSRNYTSSYNKTHRKHSILKHIPRPEPIQIITTEQRWKNDIWNFNTVIKHRNSMNLVNYKTRHKSNFQSPYTGTLKIDLETKPENESKVKFTTITVYFY